MKQGWVQPAITQSATKEPIDPTNHRIIVHPVDTGQPLCPRSMCGDIRVYRRDSSVDLGKICRMCRKCGKDGLYRRIRARAVMIGKPSP
jgi:hypothetical protein